MSTYDTTYPSAIDSIEINASDIDPILGQVAVLAGLFSAGNDGNSYVVNTGWFSDPIASIEQIPSAQQDRLLGLLEALLGKAAGNTLGTPKNTLSGNWYPIKNPIADDTGKNEPVGLYIVTSAASDAANQFSAPNQSTVIGLGLLHTLTYGSMSLTVYAYLPLIQMPAVQGSYFVLGQQPAELGFEITGENGAFASGDLSFDGLRVAVDINFPGGSLSRDIKPEIVLLNLRLPGSSEPEDLSITDLIEQGSIDKWIAMALSVLSSQLANSASTVQSDIAAMLHDVLTLMGLTDEIPSFDWSTLYQNPSAVGQLVNNWFRSIAGSSGALKSWLNAWYCLRNGISTDDNKPESGFVTGSGSRTDPFTIELSQIAKQFDFSFTVGTEVDGQGNLHVYPGLRLTSGVIKPLGAGGSSGDWSSQVGVQCKASVEMFELLIPPAGQTGPDTTSEKIFPTFDIAVALLNAVDQSNPLIDIPGPSPASGSSESSNRFRLGTTQIGFSLTASSQTGARTLTPIFRLTGVETSVGSWSEIDLTNFDNDVQILKDAVGTIVQRSLTNFLQGQAGSTANNLATVLGIIPPAFPEGQWPISETLLSSTDAIAALINNPLSALGQYYTKCLTTVDSKGRPIWGFLLPSLVTLLGGAAGQTITGDQAGTADEPWQVKLLSFSDDKPGLYLQAWSANPDRQSDKTELHLALSFGVPITFSLTGAPSPLSQINTNVELKIDLLNLNLPDSGSSDSPSANWLRGVSADLQVSGATAAGQPTPIRTPDLAGASLQLDNVMVAAGWNGHQGFYWSCRIANARLSSSTQAIPLLEFTSGSAQQAMQGLDQLAQVVVNAAGLWLLDHGGKFGLTVVAGLGLVPNLPDLINGKSGGKSFETPSGLTLPTN